MISIVLLQKLLYVNGCTIVNLICDTHDCITNILSTKCSNLSLTYLQIVQPFKYRRGFHYTSLMFYDENSHIVYRTNEQALRLNGNSPCTDMVYLVPGCSTFSYILNIFRPFHVPVFPCQSMAGFTDHSID